MPDQPTSARLTTAFAALVQCLCAAALAGRLDGRARGTRGDYQQNRWAAARFGPRAELVHPEGERLATVPALAAELLEWVETDAVDDLLAALDPTTCEGDLQEGEPHAVAADLVRRTLG